MTRWLAVLALLVASGCATGPATDCAGFKPIRPTAADVERMSDELVGQLLAHNEFGREHCGWTR